MAVASFFDVFVFVFRKLMRYSYACVCLRIKNGGNKTGVFQLRSDIAFTEDAYSEGDIFVIFLNCLEK